MALIPEITDKPLVFVSFVTKDGDVDYGDRFDTLSGAWADALSRATTNLSDSWVSHDPLRLGNFSPDSNPTDGGHARASVALYKLIGISATGYLKVWWDEIGKIGYDLRTSFVTPRIYTFDFPTGNPYTDPHFQVDYSSSGIAYWPASDTYTMDLTMPSWPDVTSQTETENFRFSCIEGYTPPTDGSANGFPV